MIVFSAADADLVVAHALRRLQFARDGLQIARPRQDSVCFGWAGALAQTVRYLVSLHHLRHDRRLR